MPLHGFATSDKQRIEAFVRRGVRLGQYGDSDRTPMQLTEDADEMPRSRLFSSWTEARRCRQRSKDRSKANDATTQYPS